MRNNKNKKYIIWKTNSSNIKIASVRYRCLFPALFLDDLGYESIIIGNQESIELFENCIALIFVKTFSKHDYNLAIKAHQFNIPIILDLCDDIFVKNYSNAGHFDYFDQMACIASKIVTIGEELATTIRSRLKMDNVVIIPDQVESLEVVNRISIKINKWRGNKYLLNGIFGKLDLVMQCFLNLIRGLKGMNVGYKELYFSLETCRKYLKESIFGSSHINVEETERKRIVWFGNYGASYSNFGMTCLLDIKDHLININKKIPIELIVISNKESKYEEFIKPFPFPTKYKKWGIKTIFNDIAQCDICVVPSYNDNFSLCKSPNRTLLALSLGVPVVATHTSALEQLDSCVILNNWEEGLLTYLTDKSRVQQDIDLAKAIIELKFTGKAIANQWDVLLSTIK